MAASGEFRLLSSLYHFLATGRVPEEILRTLRPKPTSGEDAVIRNMVAAQCREAIEQRRISILRAAILIALCLLVVLRADGPGLRWAIGIAAVFSLIELWRPTMVLLRALRFESELRRFRMGESVDLTELFR
jgi:hypothetical protein